MTCTEPDRMLVPREADAELLRAIDGTPAARAMLAHDALRSALTGAPDLASMSDDDEGEERAR